MSYHPQIISNLLLIPSKQFLSREKDLSKLSMRELDGLTSRINNLHQSIRIERSKRLYKNSGGIDTDTDLVHTPTSSNQFDSKRTTINLRTIM